MAEIKSKPQEKTVEPEGEVFNFTRDGIVIIAKNRQEAEKLFVLKLKEVKESDNG